MGNEKTLKGYLQNCKKYKRHNYRELPNDMLEYLHKTDLLMLKEIQRIFRENNICYCAVGGTLLGAYTTGHYIPWDEDIDLAVFEEDYDRAIDALMGGLPKSMILQCSQTEPQYYHEWIKVADLNSTVYPNNGVYKYQGCWVDIYKLRRMKKKDVPRNIALDHRSYLKRRMKVGDIAIREYIHRMHTNKVYSRIAKGMLHSLIEGDSEFVYLIGTASKPFVEEKYVFPIQEYPFENTIITSFFDAAAYLSNHYGENFRELPPEEDRNITINRIEYKL